MPGEQDAARFETGVGMRVGRTLAGLGLATAFAMAAQPASTPDDDRDFVVVGREDVPYNVTAPGLYSATGNSGAGAFNCNGDMSSGCLLVTVPNEATLATIEIVDDVSPRSLLWVESDEVWLCDDPRKMVTAEGGTRMMVILANGECQGLPAAVTSGFARFTFFAEDR